MESLIKDVTEYITDQLEDNIGLDSYGSDLHHELLNTAYFKTSTKEAKEWLNGFSFDAVEKVKEYEQDNFGKVSTNLSDPVKVSNMLSYVLGEEILNNSDLLTKYCWDRVLNESSIKIILNELITKQNLST